MSTVCIIGHGRSPEGRGWGSKIDLASIVIRMWDCAWQAPDDYGTKYDYGLYELGLTKPVEMHNKRTPEKGWLASVLWKSGRTLPNTAAIIDQAPWNRLGQRLGGVGQTGRLQFTRGTIAACWAIEELLVEGDELVLVGFDVVRVGITASVEESFAPVYRSNPGTFSFAGWKPDQTKYGNHDYAIERPVMEHLSKERGVNLSFAQDIWEC